MRKYHIFLFLILSCFLIHPIVPQPTSRLEVLMVVVPKAVMEAHRRLKILRKKTSSLRRSCGPQRVRQTYVAVLLFLSLCPKTWLPEFVIKLIVKLFDFSSKKQPLDLYFLNLNLLVWQWLIKLYGFQVYISNPQNFAFIFISGCVYVYVCVRTCC